MRSRTKAELILTFRYNGAMAYVKPGATYQDAIHTAREAFQELKHCDPHRISISVNGVVNKKRQLIRISPKAWKAILASRARYEVLDITLEPEIVVTDVDADSDDLPRYTLDEKMDPSIENLAPSRAPTPSDKVVIHKYLPGASVRSRPGSRSPSPSPSMNSQASRESSTSAVDWAKSLLARVVRVPQ
ncbi:hypothetical protein OH77DRAFT_1431521 [Trametes cingulata]|nr:hypothetical protein OH77DRAFT_1431521 [Trametes cingulata]